jgi:hypothetical protein
MAFWRREIPEESRRRKAIDARSRARGASVREDPRPSQQGSPISNFVSYLQQKGQLPRMLSSIILVSNTFDF